MMKNILILTDFSDNATHAAKWAAILNERLQGDIMLYNSFYNHPVTPTYAGGSLIVEELILRREESLTKLEHLSTQLKHIAETRSDGCNKPKIDFKNGKGRIGETISAILYEKNIAFIIMGASLSSGVAHTFFGYDTMEVINHADCPVIIIPQSADLKMVKKLTVATGFEIADINAIDHLVKLAGQLSLELEIVHVSLFGRKEDMTRQTAFRTHLSYLEAANVTYKEVKGKNAIGRLNKLCKKNGSDMLALVHYEHGFLQDLFNKSNTKQALSHQHLPLLIIPYKMKSNEKNQLSTKKLF